MFRCVSIGRYLRIYSNTVFWLVVAVDVSDCLWVSSKINIFFIPLQNRVSNVNSKSRCRHDGETAFQRWRIRLRPLFEYCHRITIPAAGRNLSIKTAFFVTRARFKVALDIIKGIGVGVFAFAATATPSLFSTITRIDANMAVKAREYRGRSTYKWI